MNKLSIVLTLLSFSSFNFIQFKSDWVAWSFSNVWWVISYLFDWYCFYFDWIRTVLYSFEFNTLFFNLRLCLTFVSFTIFMMIEVLITYLVLGWIKIISYFVCSKFYSIFTCLWFFSGLLNILQIHMNIKTIIWHLFDLIYLALNQNHRLTCFMDACCSFLYEDHSYLG